MSDTAVKHDLAGLAGETPSVSKPTADPAAKAQYNTMITTIEQSGKPPTRGQQGRLAYSGQLGGLGLDAIIEKFKELGATEIRGDLPVPGRHVAHASARELALA